MALEFQPRDETDVFLLRSTISLTNRRAVGTASLKEMLRNEGTRLLYRQRSARCMPVNEHCFAWLPNDRTLQSPLSTVCGQYCVAFLMFRCRNVSMHAFTRSLFTTDLVANDCRVFDWIAAVNKNDDDVFVRVCCVRVCCVVHTKGQRSRNEGSRFLYHCALHAGRTALIGRYFNR